MKRVCGILQIHCVAFFITGIQYSVREAVFFQQHKTLMGLSYQLLAKVSIRFKSSIKRSIDPKNDVFSRGDGG